jgi:hypothetical protein
MSTLPLAYKYVALAVMIAEINFCDSRLPLKSELPVTDDKIIHQLIMDPREYRFGGRLDTESYSYSFSGNGRLVFITKLEDRRWQSYGLYRGSIRMTTFMEKLAQVKSTIDTNDAYRLATNWLAGVGVDIEKLNKNEPLIVKQEYLSSSNGEKKLIPLFHINWGDRGNDGLGHHIGPIVDIMMSGINGDLLNLRQEKDLYSKRPIGLIKDMDKLLAISDEEFLKYSDMERSNLVVRFSAVTYSALTNAMPSAKAATNAVTTTNAPPP